MADVPCRIIYDTNGPNEEGYISYQNSFNQAAYPFAHNMKRPTSMKLDEEGRATVDFMVKKNDMHNFDAYNVKEDGTKLTFSAELKGNGIDISFGYPYTSEISSKMRVELEGHYRFKFNHIDKNGPIKKSSKVTTPRMIPILELSFYLGIFLMEYECGEDMRQWDFVKGDPEGWERIDAQDLE